MTAEKRKKQKSDLLYANGIDAVTGDYALPPMTAEDLKKGIISGFSEPEAKALKNWRNYVKQRKFGVKEGVNARKLEEAGWGIVFPVNADPAVVDALRPLMEWRRQQAGELYHEYLDNPKGAVRPAEADSKGSWLGRQGAENYGPVDPDKVPYYLLLVGSPEQIDYRFQYLLDVQYAVGRIAFDTPDEYASYAQSVIAAEKALAAPGVAAARRRQISFFGVANEGDPATQLSARSLIDPLVNFTGGLKPTNANPWEVQTILREEATKARLGSLLGGAERPGLLFTASHGMGFPRGDVNQVARQGALLCQDWPGPNGWRGKPIPEDFYFSANDLSADADLLGLIAFFFACYSAGTPQYDEFYRIAFKDRAQIAGQSFVAGLPRKMLAHPRGGALAVIGHVERAWGYSFMVEQSPSLEAFRSSLNALMSGAPVGLAFEYFNERYAEFTTDLTDKVQSNDWNPVDPLEIASAWTATSDAKNYVILGDPAVRVCAAEQAGDVVGERPVIVITQPAQPAGHNGGAVKEEAATSPVMVNPADAYAGAPIDYSLLDGLNKARENIGVALGQFTQKLSGFLSSAIDNAVTLQVSTYTSNNMDSVVVRAGTVSGASLRALTVLQIDGDIKQVVPVDANNQVDTGLWQVHLDMVREAQKSRADLLQTAVSAVSGLLGPGAKV